MYLRNPNVNGRNKPSPHETEGTRALSRTNSGQAHTDEHATCTAGVRATQRYQVLASFRLTKSMSIKENTSNRLAVRLGINAARTQDERKQAAEELHLHRGALASHTELSLDRALRTTPLIALSFQAVGHKYNILAQQSIRWGPAMALWTRQSTRRSQSRCTQQRQSCRSLPYVPYEEGGKKYNHDPLSHVNPGGPDLAHTSSGSDDGLWRRIRRCAQFQRSQRHTRSDGQHNISSRSS